VPVSGATEWEVPPWGRRPGWADRLLLEVSRELPADFADVAGWPDPHGTGPPEERRYSVCSDPGKYRILDQRIEAWGRALVRLGLAEVEVLVARPEWLGALRPAGEVDRVWVLRPSVEDGLTLWFARSLVDGEPFGIDVGVSADLVPVVQIESVPDCGCDACDHGSEPELDAIDAAVLTVARGGVVHARADGDRHATAGINTWHASNHAPDVWLDADASAPHGVRRWLGAPWLDEVAWPTGSRRQ
jgi:hypothetical protein